LRPTRLELEGFASFRQHTTIDFGDAQLFVLSGPTGSGKTSIIDAITFCLYGTVARYNDRRLVEPVISKGRNEARVSLQFTVAGAGYTAVRVVRRTRTGASTKEARLEAWRDHDPADARTIAGTADEVSVKVHELLGLGYEHFTRTVVLPQGAFQQFLHGSQRERADLLNELLAIGVFDTVASSARTRASSLAGQVSQLQAQLDGELGTITEDAVAAAAARSTNLGTAIERIDAARPGLDRLLEHGRDQAGAEKELRTQLKSVAGIVRPDGIDDLVARAEQVQAAAQSATASLERAEQEREAAEEAVEALPSADAIKGHRQRTDELAQANTAVDELQATAAAARRDDEDARAHLASAEAALAQADRDLDDARRGDMVAALVSDVGVGDDCPVCARPLEADIEVDATALEHARHHQGEASTTVAAARNAASTAAAAFARAQADHDAAARRHLQLAEIVADSDLPSQPDDLDEIAAKVAAAVARRTQARTALTAAKDDVKRADRATATVQQATRTATTALATARDDVAALGPPTVADDDLDRAWKDLTTWARDQERDLQTRITTVSAAVETARGDYREALAALRSDLTELDVATPDATQVDHIRDAVVEQRARATARHEELVRLREQRRAVSEELATRRGDAAVAETLGRLLDKRNFQRWLTTRALGRLVVGATRHLDHLTDGAYGLTVDTSGDFAIIDRANAGELRPARSLSGGETFLASLALALSLSEQVTDLAAGGAARLESLFIDEGFGTLDASTIDVVRAALEELGATGRMVGVVTHVPALAEQLPVQFRVRKEAQTSVVERVDL